MPRSIQIQWGGEPAGKRSCIGSYFWYTWMGLARSLSPNVCDQPGKNPLKYPTMAGDRAQAMERTNGEMYSFSHRAIMTRAMEGTNSEIHSFSHWAIMTRAMERTNGEIYSFSHWAIITRVGIFDIFDSLAHPLPYCEVYGLIRQLIRTVKGLCMNDNGIKIISLKLCTSTPTWQPYKSQVYCAASYTPYQMHSRFSLHCPMKIGQPHGHNLISWK